MSLATLRVLNSSVIKYSCLQSLWITTWCSSDIPNRASKVTSDGHRNPGFHPQLYAGGGQIVETPFTSASDMDDMLLQCNKNAIYVLNSSYAYGEFGRLNLFGSTTGSTTGLGGITNNNVTPSFSNFSPNNFCRTSRVQTSAPTLDSSPHSSTSCSSIPRLFQCIRDENQNRQPQQLDSFSKCRTNTSTVPTTTIPATLGTSSSKKSSNVKSAIIAKKTKFWKCLEEEKWKKQSIENLSTTNCERNSDGKPSRKSSTSNNNNNNNNNNSSNNNNNNNNSWSRRSDNSNRKSSTELYREAAQLLGLSCTLCDNCRCLDCQSRYFECDDSDTYSEISFMGEYIEALQEQHLSDCSRNQYSHSCGDNETNCPSTIDDSDGKIEDAVGGDSNDSADN